MAQKLNSAQIASLLMKLQEMQSSEAINSCPSSTYGVNHNRHFLAHTERSEFSSHEKKISTTQKSVVLKH